jgi:hypothetical protein
MTSVAGRLFRPLHRMLRGVAALCNWLRLVDLDVSDRSPLSVLGSGVVPEAEKVLRGGRSPASNRSQARAVRSQP